MKKILYQIKNHIKYSFKRSIVSFDLLYCKRFTKGGYVNKKTYDMVLKKYKKTIIPPREYHIPKDLILDELED